MRLELWLTEGIQMTAVCREAAELLDVLSKAGISVADVVETGSGRYTFFVRGRDAQRAVRLGSSCGAEVSICRRRGLYHFFGRFRKRIWLLLAPLPFLLWFMHLSTLLWTIDVAGNRTLTRAEILTALEETGVSPGVSGLHLDNTRIRNCMLEKLDRLSWCTVRVNGSRAVVIVRERRMPPKILDESLHREVIARRGGTLEKLQVLEGKAVVKRGAAVETGDLLITGNLNDKQGGTRMVHACGRAMATTVYEKTLELPTAYREKRLTGNVTRRTALVIGDLRLNFYNESSISYEGYDRIQTEKRLKLLGLELPVRLSVTEYREYRLSEVRIEAEEACAVLKTRLLSWLEKTAPDAELLFVDFKMEESADSIRVIMAAACLEDIALEREIPS